MNHLSRNGMALLAAFILGLSGCAQLPSLETSAGQGDLQAASNPEAMGNQHGTHYLIGPEDTLEISVWREEELQREVIVRPDGRISFPLAGDVQAAGLNAEQVAEQIEQRLKKYIPDPVVTVSVAKVAGYKVYVLGKVARPGEFVVGRYVDVMQALTLAGGLTPFASENGIFILRRENGQETVLPFQYATVRNGEGLEQNIMLRSGDVVVVP